MNSGITTGEYYVPILNDEEWRKARKRVITATQASCVLGVNPWMTANKMWEAKQKDGFIHNSYVIMGQWLEEVVIKMVNHKMNRDFKLLESAEGKPFFVHQIMKLGATPDAREGDELLECKTTKPHNLLRWTKYPPRYYVLQLMVQLMCTDLQQGYLAIMGTDLTQQTEELKLPLAIFRVYRDNRVETILEEELERFWKTVKEGKKPRSNSTAKKEVSLLLSMNGEPI